MVMSLWTERSILSPGVLRERIDGLTAWRYETAGAKGNQRLMWKARFGQQGC